MRVCPPIVQGYLFSAFDVIQDPLVSFAAWGYTRTLGLSGTLASSQSEDNLDQEPKTSARHTKSCLALWRPSLHVPDLCYEVWTESVYST